MTRKLRALLTQAAKQGHVLLIRQPQGELWKIYKRPVHLQFKGETVYEIVSPKGIEWILTIPDQGLPMLWKGDA